MMNEKGMVGKLGEDKACAYLNSCGYRIIERNFRCRTGEIDIIAVFGRAICFTEVKTRRSYSFGLPREAVVKRKQEKLIRTAAYYMLRHREYAEYIQRMDVVEILELDGKVYVNHIKNAFGEGRTYAF